MCAARPYTARDPTQLTCCVQTFKCYAHAAGPLQLFNFAVASIGFGWGCKIHSAFHFPPLAINYGLSSWWTSVPTPDFRSGVSQLQLRRCMDIDIASNVSIAMAHRACACRWWIPAGKAARAWGSWLAPAAARGRAHPRHHTYITPWKQINH